MNRIRAGGVEKNECAIDVKEWTIDERVHSAVRRKRKKRWCKCGDAVVYISISLGHQERESLGGERRGVHSGTCVKPRPSLE